MCEYFVYIPVLFRTAPCVRISVFIPDLFLIAPCVRISVYMPVLFLTALCVSIFSIFQLFASPLYV